MRISEDRYTRDRLRFDLAVRFMHHEARTHTIRRWTGLTDDRIRKLYRDYVSRTAESLTRHRGKSPAQPSYFTRTSRIHRESCALASLFCLLDVMPEHAIDDSHPVPSVLRGERLCQAFEAYTKYVRNPQITFEHAVLLVNELARGAELKLGDCIHCKGTVVIDTLSLQGACCEGCAEAS